MARQPSILNEPQRTQDEVNQILKERNALTFMTGVERETPPDYHCMVRILGEQHNPSLGVFSSDTLDNDVNKLLAQSYKLLLISYLGEAKVDGQPLAGFRFAYHFIKE